MCDLEDEVYNMRCEHASAIASNQYRLKQLENRVHTLEEIVINLDERLMKSVKDYLENEAEEIYIRGL